jgi:hypothetical protein
MVEFLESLQGAQISGSAKPHLSFVIASEGRMASFPAGTTPFFLQIEGARGVLYKKFPVCSMTQLTSSTHPLCHSTPFFLQIESARGVSYEKSPARSMKQLTSSTRPLCRSAIP